MHRAGRRFWQDRAMALDIAALRRFGIARTLFAPTTLPLALQRLGFVQADPLRAPARAQDLTLRHRVDGYRAGTLGVVGPEATLQALLNGQVDELLVTATVDALRARPTCDLSTASAMHCRRT